MHGRLKISQHKHTGKLRPHHHTSYLSLFILVAIVGSVLGWYSIQAIARADSPGPEAGSIGLSGTVPQPAPSVAAVITAPSNNQHFTTSPVTVSGTCPKDTLVEIFKNNIFAGSTPCNSDGTFTLPVDLLYGQNDLTAQVYDALNQAGPLSEIVTVYYDASQPIAAPLAFLNFIGSQILLSTDAVYRGVFPGQTLNVPITISGGTAPFAVNIDWGDGTNSVIPRSDNSVFNATHVYKKAGTYKIIIQVTDANQQVAFLTVAAIVNGQPAVTSSTDGAETRTSAVNKLLILWPLFAILITMVTSFWFGERHEKRVLEKAARRPQKSLLGSTPASPAS